MIRARNARKMQVLKPQVLSFYRKALRVIQTLHSDHQLIWYDYLRLKYQESSTLTDEMKVKQLLSEGMDDLEWTKTVVTRMKI